MADTRVEPLIPQVDNQVRECVNQCRKQGHTHHGREVEAGGRVGGVTPQSRPAKNGLGQHGTREQAPKGHPDRGHRGDQRVAGRVAPHDVPLAQAFGASCQHILLVEHLEHARAHHAGDDGRREIAKRQGR
jgi:hypothetical protein